MNSPFSNFPRKIPLMKALTQTARFQATYSQNSVPKTTILNILKLVKKTKTSP